MEVFLLIYRVFIASLERSNLNVVFLKLRAEHYMVTTFLKRWHTREFFSENIFKKAGLQNVF